MPPVGCSMLGAPERAFATAAMSEPSVASPGSSSGAIWESCMSCGNARNTPMVSGSTSRSSVSSPMRATTSSPTVDASAPTSGPIVRSSIARARPSPESESHAGSADEPGMPRTPSASGNAPSGHQMCERPEGPCESMPSSSRRSRTGCESRAANASAPASTVTPSKVAGLINPPGHWRASRTVTCSPCFDKA